MSLLTAAALAALSLASAPGAHAASAGDLDTTFGTGGTLIAAPETPFVRLFDAAAQPDGKTVMVGSAGSDTDFLVLRYNRDGSPDTTFSGDGRQTTDFAGAGDTSTAVTLDGQGRIVVAGGVLVPGDERDMGVARYLTDGSRDTSFSGDGTQTIDFDGTEVARAVTIDGAGRVLVGGSTYADGSSDVDFALARLSSDGSLDTSFSGDGRQTTAIEDQQNDQILKLAKSGTAILAAGSSGGGNSKFVLVRYRDDGSLDPTFSGDGKETTTFGTDTGNDLTGLALQTDGKVVVSGSTFDPQGFFGTDFAVARYRADGSLDPSFSGDGRQTFDFDGTVPPPKVQGYSSFGTAGVAITSTGRILVGGRSLLFNEFYEERSEFAVAALTPAGELDTAFSGDGKVTTKLGTGLQASGDVMTLGPDGRLVLAGSATDGQDFSIAAARYFSANVADPPVVGGGPVAPAPVAPAPARPAVSAACVSARAALTRARARTASGRRTARRAAARARGHRARVRAAARKAKAARRGTRAERRRASARLRAARRASTHSARASRAASRALRTLERRERAARLAVQRARC